MVRLFTTFASKVKVNLYTYNQVESTNFASKVKVNLYKYNQVQTGHLHGCHSTEEHVITMELSQEVLFVDVVMCIYTWVHRTHACTNFASKFVSTILFGQQKCVYYFC
jgi:hypothetical protein